MHVYQSTVSAEAPLWMSEIICAPSFNETDPMGVVWHGNYLRFFESAREALFDALNYGYKEMNRTGYIWPVVETKIKYRLPWMLEEKARVIAKIAEYENRLRIKYEIRRERDGKLLTAGETVHMAFDLENKAALLETPEVFRKKLGLLDK